MQSPALGQPVNLERPARDRRKRHGVHYTPSDLARFVARRTLAALEGRACLVLDPACGEGELLVAFALEAQAAGFPPPYVVGVDRDAGALKLAAKRLAKAPTWGYALRCGDFLSMDFHGRPPIPSVYDVVISNPPYVRTQVLGASQAQALRQRFGLSGRVDLYHAFVSAMTECLFDDGVLGLLCSNRFMTTKGGHALRTLLLERYSIMELWDLGDTKLFEAAVLPAAVIGRRTGLPADRSALFVRVYEDRETLRHVSVTDSLLSALEADVEGAVRVEDKTFKIERGELSRLEPMRPWRLMSAERSRWTSAVKKRTAGRFGDMGRVRVGIKTTADNVFIRSTWWDLPEELRPEKALIRPLITHRIAALWRSSDNQDGVRWVLYPHEIREGRRQPVQLSDFPRAAAYLEQHREKLEGRKYVSDAGRAWYEIWVPHQPDAWDAPKLVWPDISERPRFFLDESSAIVNGDCYWVSCGDLTEDEVALAMAVANSSFALRYYDECCGNRLYAGRRRFITQYLKDLPLPEVNAAAAHEVKGMVRRLLNRDTDVDAVPALESSLNLAVWELFGLKEIAGQS